MVSFPDNLGKPSPEKQTILNFNEARDDAVEIASTGITGLHANHLYLLQTDNQTSTLKLTFNHLY